MYRLRTQPPLLLTVALLALGCGGSESTGPSTGTLQVTASTTGAADLDPDGYMVAVNGGSGQPLGINGSVTFLNVKAGTRTVPLSGVAPNCTVMSPDPLTVAVAAGDSVQTVFRVSCALLAIRPIAFSSNRTVSTNIYAMNADGSGVVHLTYSTPDYRLRDASPAWSPDGTRIAFWSTRDGDYWEIWAINADGTGLTRLTNSPGPFFDSAPIVWSPDGKRIAFIASGDIYVMSADGSSSLNVTNNPPAAPSGGVAWSPDGLTIAFDKSEVSGFLGIWVVNVDGSGLRPIAPSGNFGNFAPAWRPR